MTDVAAEKKKHPKGLYVLFSTEAAERFSFYTMRAILVLYLTKALAFERDGALKLYGTYLLLVYLSGLPGGYLADKVLGSRKAILMGGIVMMVGLFVMGIPGEVALYYGLGLIVAGNGFFKPNISTIVSGLYEEGDVRRDSAFTIFYMGINLGAFLAIFGAGFAESLSVDHAWGWNIGFIIAGAGMIISLILFVWGQRLLGTAGFPPGREVTADTRLEGRDYRDIVVWAVVVIVAVAAAIFVWGYVGPVWNELPVLVKVLVGVGLILAAGFGVFQRSKKQKAAGTDQPLTKEEWQRVAVIVILSVFVIFFWAGFEQAGGTMNLFAFEQTNRHIGSWEMPATWFQGFNPIFIVALAPLFSILWAWNDKKKWGLPTPGKMGVGMIVLGLGFVLMYYGQQVADAEGQAGMMWLVVVYLLHTMGELCLSPIGLSMVTKLSPVRIVSLMMGVWFACTAFADYLSGRLEAFCHHFEIGLWSTLIATSVGAGVVLLCLTPVLNKWMHNKG